ncbi:nad mitochondrial-like [Limosa lapponica baueri]|uniref:proton-translocating NAD(P)(+) transhydrogenase n=1 Tax=Limosa lapponica baueri TaxID=1758121 RepID=A0A2I0UQ09_LIMLA|nr:nad mitochondrial-like [Limosa lapponica baueri]
MKTKINYYLRIGLYGYDSEADDTTEEKQGVVSTDYKDLPNRMATQASSLYSNSILKLLKLFLLRKDIFHFEQQDDLDYGAIDHVIRGILVMKIMCFGSVVCCAGMLVGLSSQNTCGFGNALGVIGVSEI